MIQRMHNLQTTSHTDCAELEHELWLNHLSWMPLCIPWNQLRCKNITGVLQGLDWTLKILEEIWSKIFFMYSLFWGKKHILLLLKAQKAKDCLFSVSYQNFEKGSMMQGPMQKGLLKFACYPDSFVLANRFNRLLHHHVCHCKHSPHAMPAPSMECCVCHSPSRLVYQPLQQDLRDLANPECKEIRIQI